MIIPTMYHTKIECGTYNLTIDNTTSVTVTLTDYNGNPVVGESVTLTCSQGYFTQTGTPSSLTDTENTTTTSFSTTTDSNGQISATYMGSEWGLTTFSTNNTNTQIKVKGWKNLGILNWGTLYYNDELRIAQLYLRIPGVSFTANEIKKYTSPTLSQFMPKSNVVGGCWLRPDVTVVIFPQSSDNLRVNSKVAQSNIDLNISLTWTY